MTLSDEIDKMGKQLQVVTAERDALKVALEVIIDPKTRMDFYGYVYWNALSRILRIAETALSDLATHEAQTKWLSDYPKSGLPVSDHVDRIDQPQ